MSIVPILGIFATNAKIAAALNCAANDKVRPKSARRSFTVGGFILLAAALAPGQAPARYSNPTNPNDAIRRPPVPADPQELVTAAAQPIADAQQRIAAISLLTKARDLSNVRAQPYYLKTTFVASGGSSSDGSWTLEDMSQGRKYRWVASGPNYSAVNLYPDGTANGLYSNQNSGALPLRLLQARSAIWFIYLTPGPQASIRTASGFLSGMPQSCVLVVIGAGSRTFSGGRNWEESEYCMDARTGLLSQYSPVPGVFVRYDYSSGIQFHDKSIPTSFTIFQNGRAVVEARTANVAEPPAASDPVFNAAGLTPLGFGRVMSPGTMRWRGPFPRGQVSSEAQMVVLHGNSFAGNLTEIEVLASTDPALNREAVNRAASFAQVRAPSQPGATMQSSELFFTFEFVPPGR